MGGWHSGLKIWRLGASGALDADEHTSKRITLLCVCLRILASCPCGAGGAGLRCGAPAASAAGENSGGIAWRMKPQWAARPAMFSPLASKASALGIGFVDLPGSGPSFSPARPEARESPCPLWPWPRRARRPACACDLRCYDGPRVPGAGSRCAHPGTAAPLRRRSHRMRS